jgi:hypothetical protein
MSLSADDIAPAIAALSRRLRALEAMERAETAGGVATSTVAGLPAAGQAGRLRFATNGRKTGEGAGAGTGVLVYDDAVGWRRVDDGTAVAA